VPSAATLTVVCLFSAVTGKHFCTCTMSQLDLETTGSNSSAAAPVCMPCYPPAVTCLNSLRSSSCGLQWPLADHHPQNRLIANTAHAATQRTSVASRHTALAYQTCCPYAAAAGAAAGLLVAEVNLAIMRRQGAGGLSVITMARETLGEQVQLALCGHAAAF
jgi:hypothetical protein